MSPPPDIEALLKDAAAAMKSDLRGAIATLESALGLARKEGNGRDCARISEELARAFGRRKSPARSLRAAREATRWAPERKEAWTTLAKTCELVATRTNSARHAARARALYRGASLAFKKAASLTKDPEDKRWLLELAGDSARAAKG